MSVPTLPLNAVQVLALAAAGVALGGWLKRRLRWLDRLNVPAPVAGGLVYALAALLLHDRFLNLDLDLVLRDILMVAFFTTIGMSASARMVKAGGPQLLLFLGIATAGAILQNLLGVGLAAALGVNPLLGVVTGSVALAGGPATALAFGATFEQMGAPGATTLAIAAAMFGIAAAGVFGGAIGGVLVRKHRLTPSGAATSTAATTSDARPALLTPALLHNVLAVALAMGLGTLLSAALQSAGIKLPSYIGAMVAAAVVRNLDDHFHLLHIAPPVVEAIGTVSLYLFIVMAMMALRLWELQALAVPVLVILLAQVALVWAMCLYLSFRLMGRDYESAVMAAGFCGFMLGITANAVASMDELVQKYGPAPRAFVIVPVVGAFLIDFTNSLVITASGDLVRAYLLK